MPGRGFRKGQSHLPPGSMGRKRIGKPGLPEHIECGSGICGDQVMMEYLQVDVEFAARFDDRYFRLSVFRIVVRVIDRVAAICAMEINPRGVPDFLEGV